VTLISAEGIGNETKKIKLHLNDALQSVSKYNGNYKEIQVDAAVLSALALVVSQHPENITWKNDAKYVRDVAFDMGNSAKGLAQANYDPTKLAYEKLSALLMGNKPADVADAAATMPFSEVSSRGPLMRRMDKGFNAMKSNVNNEDTFKKEKEMILHEATILATLGKVISTPGYDGADEEDYQKFIQDFVKANLDIISAAKEGAYDKFNDAMSRSYKACTECHQSYRNS
jgi:hypothetical protein